MRQHTRPKLSRCVCLCVRERVSQQMKNFQTISSKVIKYLKNICRKEWRPNLVSVLCVQCITQNTHTNGVEQKMFSVSGMPPMNTRAANTHTSDSTMKVVHWCFDTGLCFLTLHCILSPVVWPRNEFTKFLALMYL